MTHNTLAKFIAVAALGAAAPLAAQQPVQPIQVPAPAPTPAAAGGPPHPVLPVVGRAPSVTLITESFRPAPTPSAPTPAVAPPRTVRREPTLAEHLAATAAPQLHGDPLPPLPPDEGVVQPPATQRAAAPVPVREAPTLTQLLNAPGPRPAAATARCKDGSYVTTSSPTDADCAAHAGVAVFFSDSPTIPSRPPVRQ